MKLHNRAPVFSYWQLGNCVMVILFAGQSLDLNKLEPKRNNLGHRIRTDTELKFKAFSVKVQFL